jgi:Ricin-type beta-trefoil lectin domain-like
VLAHTKRIIAAFAAVAAAAWPAAVFTGAGVAHADVAYTYFPLWFTRDVFPGPPGCSTTGTCGALVVVTPVFMQQGEMRRVTDQLDIRMPGGHDNPEVDMSVECIDPQGNTQGAGSGTNYTGDNDANYQWNASMLLVAPTQGNYYCGILTTAVDYQTTVLAPPPDQTTYGTWLQVGRQEFGAQTWSWNIDTSSIDGHSCNTGPFPDPTTTPAETGCQYIGGPARLKNPPAIDVSTPSWTAGENTQIVDAVATFQITACSSGTKSCPDSEHGDSGVYDSKGESYLDINQLYPDGKTVCQVNRAYSEVVPGSQGQTSPSFEISDKQHHLPQYYEVSAPVMNYLRCGGSRQFALDLHIQWTGDNGIKIDGGRLYLVNSVSAPLYTIYSYWTDMCLQPINESTEEGAAIVQEPCNYSPAQQWFSMGGPVFRYRNGLSNMCLDARGGAENGTPVQQWTCDSITNENWEPGQTDPGGHPPIPPMYSRVSGTHSYCLDIPDAQPTIGLAMQIFRCNGTPAQQWTRP